jgi:hypothetical protein
MSGTAILVLAVLAAIAALAFVNYRFRIFTRTGGRRRQRKEEGNADRQAGDHQAAA